MHHIISPPFYHLFHFISVLINIAAETSNPQILVAYNNITLHVDFGLPLQSGSIPHVFILRLRLKEKPLSGPAICMVVRIQRARRNL